MYDWELSEDEKLMRLKSWLLCQAQGLGLGLCRPPSQQNKPEPKLSIAAQRPIRPTNCPSYKAFNKQERRLQPNVSIPTTLQHREGRKPSASTRPIKATTIKATGRIPIIVPLYSPRFPNTEETKPAQPSPDAATTPTSPPQQPLVTNITQSGPAESLTPSQARTTEIKALINTPSP